MQQKLIYLTPDQPPKTLYTDQTFAFSIVALVAEKDFDELSTTIGEATGLRQINQSPKWHKIDEDRYKITLFFQVTDTRVALPTVEISLVSNGEVLDSTSYDGASLSASKIAKNPQFSQVVANSLEVVTHKVERFNDEQNILIMELKADYSNLLKFQLTSDDIDSQGIDWSEVRLPTAKILYYAIIPPTKDSISFNYFVPTTGDFKRVDLALDLSSLGQKISTHSDINPNKKDIPWMNIFLLTIVAITLIFFFFKTHKWIFLVVVAINATLIFWLVIKDDTVLIKTGAHIRLLPTTTSTLFYITSAPTEAKVLKRKDDFYKVLLPDEKIGWVKRSEAAGQ